MEMSCTETFFVAFFMKLTGTGMQIVSEFIIKPTSIRF